MELDSKPLLYTLAATLFITGTALDSMQHAHAQQSQSLPHINWTLALNGTVAHGEQSSTGRRKGTGRMPRAIRGIGADGEDGVYISGSFFGNSSLGSTTLVSAGTADVLVGRIDKHGRTLWFRRFGSPGIDMSTDVTRDSLGRCVLTGMSGNGTRFDNHTIRTEGRSDAFTAQLDQQGRVLWVKTIGGSALDSGNEIATDDHDNVLVAGNSYGELSVGDAKLPHNGGMDGFIIKYASNGEFRWIRQIAGKADEQTRGIVADSHGNVIVVGEFTGTIHLGNRSLTSTSAKRDIFVAKYDQQGELVWARSYGNSGEDYARGVDSDAAGNLYITGVFSGQVRFGQITLQGTANREQLFIARLSASGDVDWARGITGSGQGHGCEIDVTDGGDSVISCDVMGELGTDGFRITSSGRRDSFVARFDSRGQARWVQTLGASGSAANFDVVLNRTGQLVTVAGTFRGSLGSGIHRIQSSDGISGYVVRLTPADIAH